MEDVIVQKMKQYDMGHSLNHIQNTAEKVLTKKRWREYLLASNKDAQVCDGMDGILLNGEYFDWKEFGYRKNEIVKAYLRYFTEEEVQKIACAI